MSPRVLIVDDEPPIIDMLTYNLKRAGYQVASASDGEAALTAARRDPPDLVILDLMLPKLDGLEVCRALRRERDVPIIMLTARDSEVDRVVGLEMGADDYVVKPFSVRELLARVKNVLRRGAASSSSNHSVVHTGPLKVDPAARQAWLEGIDLGLTTLEFDLLHTLACHPNQVLTREKLLEMVWGYDYYGDLRAVDAAIKRLRFKLSQMESGRALLQTVRGVGYKLAG
jgi:two-component system response regulator VicR